MTTKTPAAPPPQQPPAEAPNPSSGGSYVRDPKTGELRPAPDTNTATE